MIANETAKRVPQSQMTGRSDAELCTCSAGTAGR